MYDSRDGSDTFEYGWDSPHERKIPLECSISIEIVEGSQEFDNILAQLQRKYGRDLRDDRRTRRLSRTHIALRNAQLMADAMTYVPAANMSVYDALFRMPVRVVGDSIDFRESKGKPHALLYHVTLRLVDDFRRDSDGAIRLLPSSELSSESFNALDHGSKTHDKVYFCGNPAIAGLFVQNHWKTAANNAIRHSGDGSITVDVLVVMPTNHHYWGCHQIVMNRGGVSPDHANLCSNADSVVPDIILRLRFKDGIINLLDSSDNVEITLLYAGGRTRAEDRLNLPWAQAEELLVVDSSGAGVFPRDLFNREAIETQRVSGLPTEDNLVSEEPVVDTSSAQDQVQTGATLVRAPSAAVETMSATLFCNKVKELQLPTNIDSDDIDSNSIENTLEELGGSLLQPRNALAILNGAKALSTLALVSYESKSEHSKELVERIITGLADQANTLLPTRDRYSPKEVLLKETEVIVEARLREIDTQMQQRQVKKELLMNRLRDVTNQHPVPPPPITTNPKRQKMNPHEIKLIFGEGESSLSCMVRTCSTEFVPPEILIKSKLRFTKQKSYAEFLRIIKSSKTHHVSFIKLNRNSNDKDTMIFFSNEYDEMKQIPFVSVQNRVWVFVASPCCLQKLCVDETNKDKMHFVIARQ